MTLITLNELTNELILNIASFTQRPRDYWRLAATNRRFRALLFPGACFVSQLIESAGEKVAEGYLAFIFGKETWISYETSGNDGERADLQASLRIFGEICRVQRSLPHFRPPNLHPTDPFNHDEWEIIEAFRNCGVSVDLNFEARSTYRAGEDLERLDEENLDLIVEALLANRPVYDVTLCECCPENDFERRFAEAMGKNKTVKSIGFIQTEFSDDGFISLFEALKNNSTVTNLYLRIYGDEAVYRAFGSLLEVNQNINDITVDMAGDVDSFSYFFNALKKNTTLKTLTLTGDMDAVTARALADSLKLNRGIQCLDLDGELDTDSDENIFKPLFEVLPHNETLKQLSIGEKMLGAFGADGIADGLSHNRSLQKLRLSSNFFSPSSGEAFGKILQLNSTLMDLDLSGNELGDEGISMLAEGLSKNHGLKSLKLSINYITESGVHRICESLKFNKTLMKLDLSRNEIGNKGAMMLAELVKLKPIHSLNLSGCGIGNEGALAMVEAVTQQNFIRKLDLSWNEIGKDGIRALKKLSKMNPVNVNSARNSVKNPYQDRALKRFKSNPMYARLPLMLSDVLAEGMSSLQSEIESGLQNIMERDSI